MFRIFMEAHSTGEFKTETGMGAQERKKQDVRRGKPMWRGNKPRQHPGRLFIPQYSAKKELGEGLHARDKNCFNDTVYACPPDTRSAKPSLNPLLQLHLVSPEVILSNLVSGLYVQQKLLMVKSISKLTYQSLPLIPHTSYTYCHFPRTGHNDYICSFVPL